MAVPVFGPPTISVGRFSAVLEAANSPVLTERPASEYYAAIVGYGLDPAFMLAVFCHESNYATATTSVVLNYGTRNWGNCRSLSIPGMNVGYADVPVKGRYVRYSSWLDGLKDACNRLTVPTYPYAPAGARTVEAIIPIWAPSSDNNNVARYIQHVLDLMAQWKDTVTVAPRIALSSGHHNHDGGNDYEHGTTGPLTQALARECVRLGMEVRVAQPDGPDADNERGDGEFPGGIWDVARWALQNAASGWVPDIFLEVHTEGVGNPNVRGVFAIYPDAPGDVDTDVRDRLGPAVSRAISKATGMPTRGGGIMSERSTGVGSSGGRLGIFGQTAGLKQSTTRLIIEYGAHTNPVERAMHRDPKWQAAAATATAESFAAFLGWAVPPVPNPPMTNEADALKAWAGQIVFSARGELLREGIADLRAFGGGQAERVALYEKLVAHRLAGGNYVMPLSLWDRLRADGRLHIYPSQPW